MKLERYLFIHIHVYAYTYILFSMHKPMCVVIKCKPNVNFCNSNLFFLPYFCSFICVCLPNKLYYIYIYIYIYIYMNLLSIGNTYFLYNIIDVRYTPLYTIASPLSLYINLPSDLPFLSISLSLKYTT